MNRDARQCLDSAAEYLVQATGCQRSLAQQVVELIALAAVRWEADDTPEPRIPVVLDP